ncbi:MAG: hypothetical protein F6K35_34630, partial [Okeania sp. SIO2H7]|nr:hypothetical protein [Okeania sp. SIO2H7]
TPYDHSWIEFDSYKFEGNEVECKITVDTSKLLAGETYKRELLLHSNAEGESLVIPVKVKTATVETPDYSTFILTGIVAPFLLLMPGFPFLPTIERILKVNAKRRKVNVLLPVSFSVILFVPFMLIILLVLGMNLPTISSHQGVFIALFLMAIAIDAGTQIGTHSKLEKLFNSLVAFFKNNPKNTVAIVGLIILLPFVDFTGILVILLFILPWAFTILTSFCWYFAKSLVRYQNQKFFQISATQNILAIGGLSASLILAFLLTDKFELATSISNLLFEEKMLIAVVAIAPILFFSSQLGKIAVKRWRAIAQYNREKPNLIKP